ncbi:MAG: succinylglutamate desuccinylase/aspartoacylase family protein [Planctomycetes bacterium]|nr:succinylglutamate desuccinylase/aspartoacylase family protein [Planctomycetota bacterium]
MEPITLQQRTIVGHAAGPRLLITGGVHGDEFEPLATVRRLMHEFAPEQLRGQVTLVPVVNEPAFERGQRTADDDKDLARTCPGRDDGTITERIAAALARLIRDADYYIDLHTGGTVFQILALAGYTLHADRVVLERQRLMARAFNLPIVWGTSARLEGRSLSVARDANVSAIYVENGGGGTCDPRRVEQNVQGCLNVARALGMLDGATAASQVRYVVEDDRDQSGHLQVQCNAPCAGYFEPAVTLGQTVERGQTIGHIVDPLGNRLAAITAYQAGTVLLLHSFPSVRVGDPLVVILPVTAPGEASFPR